MDKDATSLVADISGKDAPMTTFNCLIIIFSQQFYKSYNNHNEELNMSFLRNPVKPNNPNSQITDKENLEKIAKFLKDILALDEHIKIKFDTKNFHIQLVNNTHDNPMREKIFKPVQELLRKKSIISVSGYDDGQERLIFENKKTMDKALNHFLLIANDYGKVAKKTPMR